MTSSESQAENKDISSLVARNASLTFAAKLISMLSRLVMPPLILSYVTLEEYGIWATCFILIGYIGMSTFGVSNVYVKYVAEYNAEKNYSKINYLVSTGLFFVLLVSLVLVGLLWVFLPNIILLFHIPPHLHHTAFVLIFGTALIFVVDFSFGAFGFVLQGIQQFAQQTLVWFVTFFIETVLIIVLLVAGFGVKSLLWALGVRYVLSTLAYVVLCYRAIPDLSLGLRYLNWESLRLFYRYGAVVQISGLLGVFLFSIGKLIAGIFIGISATGLFEVGQKFPIMMSKLPSTLNAVLLPAVSHLNRLAQHAEIKSLYIKGSRYLNMMNGMGMGFLAAFPFPILYGWLGFQEEYRWAAIILGWFTLPYQLNVLTGPCSAVHRGVGRPWRETTYPLSQLALIVLMVGIGFIWAGYTIMVISVGVASSMVMSALLYIFYTNHILKISQWQYIKDVMMPGLVPYVLGFGMAWMVDSALFTDFHDRIGTLLSLMGLGTVYLLVVAIFLYQISRRDEREWVKHYVTWLWRLLVPPQQPPKNSPGYR